MRCLFVLIVGLTCSSILSAQSKIDAVKLQALQSEHKNIQLIDLRTQAEIDKTGKIEGAAIINYSSSDFESQITKLDKSKPTIVYCAAGGRSGKTSALLLKNGFKTIYDYAGGMSDWVSKGLKTVK